MAFRDRKKIIPHNKPGAPPLSSEEREKILAHALRRMIMIGGEVFGIEDDAEPEVRVDCAARTSSCKANCCTFVFALTREEVKKGIYRYNTENPFYMARDTDGYCPYLDRAAFTCSIYKGRPIRCRKFACPF